ncbi:universal stress protein [Arthrobacter sp.]|uniref:universal stress protein n=1 Tax=Arthrobacter sp. TaxID=1667 RepID=UPI00281209F3|nr:universal stress protein [Arthrobacter sp.]
MTTTNTSTSSTSEPIIVGYDRSAGSERAVRWAARHASTTGLPLTVVHASPWPLFTDNLGPVEGIKDSGLQHEAEMLVTEGLNLALTTAPGITATKHLVTGFPANELTRLSAEASLLVTGTRGLGGFTGLLIGSVSLHLAASASCPIMIVREDTTTRDHVLIAVDGSPESDRAVLAGAALAQALHQSIQLLHALPYSRHQFDTAFEPGGAYDVAAEAERDSAIQQALNLLASDTDLTIADATITAVSIPGAIIDHARTASCVVLGAKGNNTLSARLGSTVHAVMHHSTTNVLVVR